jgi:hypothetical protein
MVPSNENVTERRETRRSWFIITCVRFGKAVFLVVPSEARHLGLGCEILRFAQDDKGERSG